MTDLNAIRERFIETSETLAKSGIFIKALNEKALNEALNDIQIALSEIEHLNRVSKLTPEEASLPNMLKVVELARYLKISNTTATQLMHHKDFPAVKIGGTWRVHRGALLDWVASRKEIDIKDV